MNAERLSFSEANQKNNLFQESFDTEESVSCYTSFPSSEPKTPTNKTKNSENIFFSNPSRKVDSKQLRKHSKIKRNSSNQELTNEFENMLLISPLHLRQHHSEFQFPKKNEGFVNTITPSKWLKDDSPEYSSLPYFPVQKNALPHEGTRHEEIRNKTRNSRGDKSEQIVLPPIRKPQLASKSHYRSISATPRSDSSLYSASARISYTRNRQPLPHRDSYKELKTMNLNCEFFRD